MFANSKTDRQTEHFEEIPEERQEIAQYCERTIDVLLLNYHMLIFALKIRTCYHEPETSNEVCNERQGDKRRQDIDRQHAAVHNTVHPVTVFTIIISILSINHLTPTVAMMSTATCIKHLLCQTGLSRHL